MELCQHLYIENLPILINIYNGTATMPFQLSTVSSVHYSIGQKKYGPPNNNWKKNKSTFNKPFHYANTQDGP